MTRRHAAPLAGRPRGSLGLIAMAAVLAAAIGIVIASLVWRGQNVGAQWFANVQESPSTASASPSPSPLRTFTLSAVGDTIVAAAPRVPPDGGKGFFDDVRDALHADLQMANLEEPITDDTGVSKCSPKSQGKTCFAFRAPPSYARCLKDAGFDLVNLANNHAYDFGEPGHKNTEATLDSLGIRYTGPPGLITTMTVRGIRVATVGFAPYRWANSLTDIPAAEDLVRKAKQQADVVVVQAHVGAEGASHTHVVKGTEYFLGENRGNSITFAHGVVDAGADIVIMHGPHVMRGMEFYKGHLIAYSMGNFAGYHALSTGGVLGIGGVLHATLTADGRFVSGKLVATSMVPPGVPRMDPKNRALSQVRSLTEADFPQTGAHIAADGTITAPE